MKRVTNHIGDQFKLLILQIADAKRKGLDTSELEAKKQEMLKIFGS